MTGNKPRVLVIQTGGTIGQEKVGIVYDDKKLEVYRPSERDPLEFVKGIYDLADIDSLRPANIDSTNMDTSHRANIGKIIYNNRSKYDGFVITHGTDTMADTAAALNYMIQDLGKPVVLTGSQKPVFEPGNDAENNVFYAIQASTMDLGEVVIAFGNKIVRGNRAIKVSEQGWNAFDSPRVGPVGEIGINIILADHRIGRYEGKASLFTAFDTFIEFYQQSSGTNTGIFEEYVDNPKVHGIVLGGYGAGNVQDRFIPHVRKATKKGKPVIVATNCLLGSADMSIYEVGSAALEAGAISAGDLTQETAVQKLLFAVGRSNKEKLGGGERLEFVRNIIHQPYAGDITPQREREKQLFGGDV